MVYRRRRRIDSLKYRRIVGVAARSFIFIQRVLRGGVDARRFRRYEDGRLTIVASKGYGRATRILLNRNQFLRDRRDNPRTELAER